MDMYEEILCEEENTSRIEALIDGNEYVFFFEKEGTLYGAGEDSRLTFAKIKNPDDDLPKDWENEANFSADNLEKTILGEPSKHIFSKSDIGKLTILDREKVIEKLKDIANKHGDKAFKKQPVRLSISNLFNNDPDGAPNFARADEE